MAIYKPSELHNWLGGLNFNVLGWQLYIGDWIEAAIDWVVTVLNTIADLASTAYALVQASFDFALQLYYLAVDYINTTVVYLYKSLSSLFGQLWAAVYTLYSYVQDLVAVTKAETQSWVLTMLTPLQGLAAALEDFFSHTLPSLWSWSTHQAWWGEGDVSHPTWWEVTHSELSEETKVQLDPVRDQVNQHTSWLDAMRQLWEDPEKWLLARLEDMVVRFW